MKIKPIQYRHDKEVYLRSREKPTRTIRIPTTKRVVAFDMVEGLVVEEAASVGITWDTTFVAD